MPFRHLINNKLMTQILGTEYHLVNLINCDDIFYLKNIANKTWMGDCFFASFHQTDKIRSDRCTPDNGFNPLCLRFISYNQESFGSASTKHISVKFRKMSKKA